jgi:hypothetical protein
MQTAWIDPKGNALDIRKDDPQATHVEWLIHRIYADQALQQRFEVSPKEAKSLRDLAVKWRKTRNLSKSEVKQVNELYNQALQAGWVRVASPTQYDVWEDDPHTMKLVSDYIMTQTDIRPTDIVVIDIASKAGTMSASKSVPALEVMSESLEAVLTLSLAPIQERKRAIWVDFDGTIARAECGHEPMTQPPKEDVISVMRRLREEDPHFEIMIFTARPWEDAPKIREYLDAHDVPYNSVICGKPRADACIDNLAVNPCSPGWEGQLVELLGGRYEHHADLGPHRGILRMDRGGLRGPGGSVGAGVDQPHGLGERQE